MDIIFFLLFLISIAMLESFVVFLTIEFCFWIKDYINNKKAD